MYNGRLAPALSLLRRMAVTAFGLLLFAWGCCLIIQANIGLDPWTALSSGLSGVTGMSFGNISVIISLAIVAIDVALKEKIGVGTILDAFLVGKFIDMFLWLDWVPKLETFAAGVAVLLVGEVFLSVGSYFYIKNGLGCGPRDSLMVAVGKRLPNLPIGVVRCMLEGAALLAGWLLGAKVGLGTVISVVCIGIILDGTFRLLHFDVRAVRHENALDSIRMVTRSEVDSDCPS